MKTVKIIPPSGTNVMEMPLTDTSAITRKWLDIDYTPDNPHPARKLDIYLPETGDGPFPTIVCIHGGAFTGGAKNDMQVAGFIDAVSAGFAVASVEQRLCSMRPDGTFDPEGRFPNPLFDFKAAIRFLRKNAAKYKLDPDRFAAAGDSAGGYHAIMAGVTGDVPVMYDDALGHTDVSDKVQAVVDWFGCGDLVLESEFNASAGDTMTMPNGMVVPRIVFEDVFLGLCCAEHANLAYFASPESWVSRDMPPALLQHGEADEIVTVECSKRLAARIREVCGDDRVTLDVFEGWAHGDERFYNDENLARMFTWLHEVLG